MKIERLEIYSPNVGEQLKFYRDLLELEIQNYTEKTFEVIIGYSVLKFSQKDDATPYHIAVHIPDKQEKEALEWVKERVKVLKNNNEEIIDFSNWSAMSVYFYDADKNILEFISRRNLHKPDSAIFAEDSLVGIAEIGLATTNISEKFVFLEKNYRLEKYDGSFEKFCAIGDDEGLIITIDKNKKVWFPTEDKAFASEFKMIFTHKGEKHQLEFTQNKLQDSGKR